jgi:Helix-turn-helix domain
LARKSASPTAQTNIVHRVNIANHRVAVLRNVLANLRRCLIDRRNADQAATGVYPYTIFRQENLWEIGSAPIWTRAKQEMFKASTGVSPHRYQLNTRIGKAQELLLMKGESLSMVPVATGFADQSHFTRTFKRGHWKLHT